MRIFIVLSVLLIILPTLGARIIPLEFGVKAGFNLAQHYGPLVNEDEYKVDLSLRPGAIAGVYVDYPILENLRLSYEVLYSMKGSREDITILMMDGEVLAKPAKMNVKYDLDYLDMPFLLKIRALDTKRLSLDAITGTAMSLKVRGHHELDGVVYVPIGDDFLEVPISEESDLAAVNMFDFSFVYGAALHLTGRPALSAELRFTLGWDYLQLPSFSTGETVELRNQTYSLLLGLNF